MNKKHSSLNFSNVRALLIAPLVFVLTACGDNGADGAAGAPGTPGTNGVPVTNTATSLTFKVDSITVASPPVVNFTLTNESGTRYVGLTASQIRFTLAKLNPGLNGSPAAWQSYINRTESKGAGEWGAGGKAVQADYDRHVSGDPAYFVDNGDGTYQYTFKNDVKNATCPANAPSPCPVDVSWQPTYTHRLGVQISSGAPITNFTYDWRPSDGATTGLTENDIVQTASCNECHGKLAVHGGSRVDTKYCVTCHNPGTTDANSGNTLDFKVFIHKLHNAADLPSRAGADGTVGTADDKPYTIWGFNDAKSDYSEVTYPQDVRNCTKCHDATDAATPQAHYWDDVPNRAACGSCHDNIDWTATLSSPQQPNEHSGGSMLDDTECTTCHVTDRPGHAPSESHVIPAKVVGAKYKFVITDVQFNSGYPKVTYKVVDPTNSDAAYNLLSTTDYGWACTAANAHCGSGASRLGIDIAWSTPEITNTCDPADASYPASPAPCQTSDTSLVSGTNHTGPGYGTAPASVIALNGLAASSGNNAAPTDNGNGTFTITSLRHVPSGVGTLMVALEGHPAGDYDGNGVFTDRVPVTSVFVYKAVNDAAAVKRRDVVDIAKCDKCHDQLSLHGSNRTDEPQVCALCHNPNNTDIAQRRANSGTASNIWPAPDGLAEQSIDFKYMVHAIHGAAKRTKPYVVYGNSNSTNDFSEVTYPGVLNNCATCHVNTSTAQTFEIPLKAEVQPTTFSSGASRTDPGDDDKTSMTAAVCSSCHDTDVAQTHMEQNGGQFSVLAPNVNSGAETCEVCHGSGRIADVSVVHSVQ